MPAEQHKKAQDSYNNASKESGKASEQYKSGNHEKGAHHAQNARGHAEEAEAATRDASKKHSEKHGNK